MFEIGLTKNFMMYPTKEEITVNKIKASTSYHVNFNDSSKNKTINITYFYNKNNDITAKIINDNNKERIHTYCYENKALKLVYKDGLLWKEYLSDNVYMLYEENESYKIENGKLMEVYDKSGIIESIAYKYNDDGKVIKESGFNYTTEYLYNRNDKLKRMIHTVDNKVVRDFLIVYKKGHYVIENLLNRNTIYIKTNKLGFPSKVTTYDKDNIKIGCVELCYTLEDDTII